MNVFISWSGERSRLVAQLLKDWLKCVLQATEPWISSDNIERGAMWFQDLSESLGSCSVGIICLTKENKNAPWILFEAGGLLKGLSSNRVCTFLVDLEPKDIEPPLSQFNHTLPAYKSMYQLISMLSDRLEAGKLEEKTLDKVFQTYWPSFDQNFNDILETSAEAKEPTVDRSESDLLTEIPYTVRSLEQQLKKPAAIDFNWPFVESSEAPLQETTNMTTSPPKFEQNELIVHKVFGPGKIVDVYRIGSDWVLAINFEKCGMKRIIYSAAQRKQLLAKVE